MEGDVVGANEGERLTVGDADGVLVGAFVSAGSYGSNSMFLPISTAL